MRRALLFLLIALFAMLLAGCEPGRPVGEAVLPYGDPYAYCAAVGTIDAPDARYGGPELPDTVVNAMLQQGIVTSEGPAEFQQNAVWRCADGAVRVCHFGANLPCLEKADSSQEPSVEMAEFCTANPGADVVPAAVTGRATVYGWECVEGEPRVVEQILHSDAQGFLDEFWYTLPTP
jgi:predicted small secreted protein